MKSILARTQLLTFVSLISFLCGTASADTILHTGNISAAAPSGGNIVGGTSTFSLTAADINDVELLANFTIIDAGVDISVNGTSLFTNFDDYSQFSSASVFLGTGVANGGIESPWDPNSNSLPRLTVDSSAAGTTFSGAATPGAGATTSYTPNFAVQDFSSLLVVGQNNIEFSVLNSFEGAELEGDFVVTLNTATAAVPEPSSVSLLGGLLVVCLSTRRRSK